jgi:hypothetical protein
MSNWENMQARLKVIIEDALKFIKSGASEAEHLAGATAQATKLHVTIRKNQIDKYKKLHELGEIVHTELQKGPGDIKATKKINDISEVVKKMDYESAQAYEALGKISVVSKPSPKKIKKSGS